MKMINDIDEKIKELQSKENPNLSLINSLKAKKAILKLDKTVKK